MRYLGNKTKLLGFIQSVLDKECCSFSTVFDGFAGTGVVSEYFKRCGKNTISNDLLYASYVLCQSRINGDKVNFENYGGVNKVMEMLDAISPEYGFIHNNYTPFGGRQFFTELNGAKIDAIRLKLEEMKLSETISIYEYYYLLGVLVNSVSYYANITGTYAAYQKGWDKRAIKEFKLQPFEVAYSYNTTHICFNNDIKNVVQTPTDLLYLDPPYNQRQYAPNYHILETIAKYDNPPIKGVTGMRDYSDAKSLFCNKRTCLNELASLLQDCNAKYVLMSYNNEGLLSEDSIMTLFGNYGTAIKYEMSHDKFSSKKGGNRGIVKEYLFLLKK